MMDDPEYQVPQELQDLLLEFTVSVLVERPSDLVSYAVEYFTKVKNENARNQADRSHVKEVESSDSEAILSDEEEEPQPRVTHLMSGANRRKSVFAEAYNPEEDDDETSQNVYHPKTDEERERLYDAVKHSLLFRSLDPNQMREVLDAMFERKVVAGEDVIVQGDDGDNFYVIESGVYNTYVKLDNEPEPRLVNKYENSGSFGELALMYNMPRAATIKAATEGKIWAMDRKTFRKILLKSSFKKRKMYEELLSKVPMLKALENYERMNLADALLPKTYSEGQQVIKQGAGADGMYFIEEGEVRVTVYNEKGVETEVSRIGPGGYFGELALVTHKPRAASVYAATEVRLAFLDVDAFERLLGPCLEILKRNIEDYENQLISIFGSKSNLTDIR